MKKILKYFLSGLFSLILVVYLFFLFVLPKIFSNEIVVDKLENLLSDKLDFQIAISNCKLKTTPFLNIYLYLDDIDAKKLDNNVFNTQNLSLKFDIKKLKIIYIKSDNIFINGDLFLKKNKNEKKKSTFKVESIPDIFVKNFIYNSAVLNMNAENINVHEGKIELKADIKSQIIKNTIKIGDIGNLYINASKLYADNFELKIGNSKLYVNGILLDENSSHDFTLKGDNISVPEVMFMLLHYQKSQDPAKKFIENFINYKGRVNLDLKFNNSGIWGIGKAEKLSANTLQFNIPAKFDEAVFYFNGDSIVSKAQGYLGKEKVVHTLNITNLGTPEKQVIGTINTILTKKFNYVPNLTILNSAHVNLTYKIKYKKIDVFYNLTLPVESDLIHKTKYLGLRNYKRKLYAHTQKVLNDLSLKEYNYSFIKDNKEQKILSGSGFFKRINDKFIPQYINCHTEGYAPVSVAGSFGEKIRGGNFKGNFNYDYVKNKLTGSLDIIDARYKLFKVDKAVVTAKDNIVNISSSGTFKGEKYSAQISGKNNFSNEILIYDMKLFLDKLVLDTEKKRKPLKINRKEIDKKINQSSITINNWEVIINEIKREKLILQNVQLLGSLKNHIFDFTMSDLHFANGILTANGFHNFSNNSSKMTFEAKNIDSNLVANMLLNLENQVEGTANAFIYLDAIDKSINVHCLFDINEGFLPKLGSTEFMIKNSKYTISQITNLDFSKKELLKYNIKGSFDVFNTNMTNINITSKQELLALLLKGDYEIKKQYANLYLFGKYDKNEIKKIKVFFIPLNWILNVVFRPENSKETYKNELSEIPHINAKENNIKYFKIQVNGNINKNKVHIITKRIK